MTFPISRFIRSGTSAGILVLTLLWVSACAVALNRQQALAEAELDDETAFVCPMHPDITADKEGKCPKCGMTLVLGKPYDMRDFEVEMTSSPEVPVAGQPVRVTFKITAPGTGEPVTDFELVHEMPYHLFVVSQDLEYFQHVHPTQSESGAWTMDLTLPRPGRYGLVSDFAPKGASSQMTMRPLVTAGADPEALDEVPQLLIPEGRTVTMADLTATVTMDPSPLKAGQHGHITFDIRRTDNGQPVNQLQTYLGAFGHLFITDAAMTDYVHSHPVETPSPQLDLALIRGGPTVMFEGLMPKAGRYRAWAQFRYNDKVYTFPTTYDVVE
jgi:hypothetical protein